MSPVTAARRSQVERTSWHARVATFVGAAVLGHLLVTVVLCGLWLPHAAQAADSARSEASREWPTVGGDTGNSRYSPLAQINTTNVRRLAGAWVHEADARVRSAPVVVGGVVYLSDATAVYALDAKNGAQRWKHIPAASPARGGVAVSDGRVYVGLANAHVVALDARTGDPIWTGYIGNIPAEQLHLQGIALDPQVPPIDVKAGFISGTPSCVNGKVIVGLSGGDAGSRSKIAALDAATGKLMWEFWVAPNPGEPGSDTWPDDVDPGSLGGGAVWTHGAADPQLGLVYFGTGNASPVLGGEVRPGDNLYMASLVALDVATGKLRWHYQLARHDLWEMDIATPPILYDFGKGRAARKAVAIMRPDGFLFAFDRATGEPLIPIEERKVPQDVRMHTAPTQPFPAGAEQFGPNCAERELLPAGFEPGCHFEPLFYDRQNVGSVFTNTRQAPMSFDPRTGLFYVVGGASPWWYRRVANPYILLVSHPPGAKEYGLVAAIDGRTHRIVWQKRSPWSLIGSSGAMTTAGGLLFRSEGDGRFLAFDSRTGEQLWSFQTGSLNGPIVLSLTGGAPSATYEVEGEQYILVPVGKSVWAFKLGGMLHERPAPPTPPTEFGFQGIVEALGPDDEIGIAMLQPTRAPGALHYVDEASFTPVRAQIGVGQPVRFMNYGTATHTIVSSDGAWTTGPIAPGNSATITISKPGKYTFAATEFPWSKGQLVVQ